MKGVDELLGVSKVCSRFPTIVTLIVSFPLDKVLELVTILTTVEDEFYLVFRFVVDLSWLWRWRCFSIYVVTPPWGEAVDVKHGVLFH